MTRLALLEAAWELFSSQGYDGTTVEEIADRAEVSRRTFFRYFPSKEAVVFARQPERLLKFQKLLKKGPGGYASVRAACLELAQDSMKEREWLLAQERLIESSATLKARDLELSREWEQSIAQTLVAVPSYQINEGRPARLLAGAILGVFRACLREWVESGGTKDLVHIGEESLKMLEQGVHA